MSGTCLKTGQHFIFVIIRKMKNKKQYTYVGYGTLIIDAFIEIIEQYFLYWNHDWQCKKLNTIEKN